MPPLITIEITDNEALLFKEFQKHHAIFTTMQEKGIFDIQFGKATLNFAFGELQNIIKEEVVWKK